MTMSNGELWRQIPNSVSEADHSFTHPTTLFEVCDFLPGHVIEELSLTFPGAVSQYRTHIRGEKKYLQNSEQAFWAALETAPTWRWLYDEFSSVDMINRLYAFASPHMTYRPDRERRQWILTQPRHRQPGRRGAVARAIRHHRLGAFIRRSWKRILNRLPHIDSRTDLDHTPVELGFEFSILEHGDAIPPHTDQVDKLLSLMLYFPSSDRQAQAPLGTEFWRGRDGRPPWIRWKSQLLDDAESQQFYADHQMFYQTPFSANVLVGFVKSDISWHGLRPLHLEPDEERRSLVINIFARPQSRRPTLRRRTHENRNSNSSKGPS